MVLYLRPFEESLEDSESYEPRNPKWSIDSDGEIRVYSSREELEGLGESYELTDLEERKDFIQRVHKVVEKYSDSSNSRYIAGEVVEETVNNVPNTEVLRGGVEVTGKDMNDALDKVLLRPHISYMDWEPSDRDSDVDFSIQDSDFPLYDDVSEEDWEDLFKEDENP